MLIPSSLLTLLSYALLTNARPSEPQHRLKPRETQLEAAIHTRQLIESVNIGSIATVFPDGSPHAGEPFAMMEYHAPCHDNTSLTFILLPVSLSVKNILQSPTHAATYVVTEPMDNQKSAMSHGRVSFIGNMTVLNNIPDEESLRLAKCYTSYHPDSKWWLPGTKDSPHFSMWGKMNIHDIYYVGGFGDTHYIGHIPLEMYANAI